jgi:nicotinamidase-related amidase
LEDKTVGYLSFNGVHAQRPERVNLNAKKTAVIVVDMQNDFVRSEGKVYLGPRVAPTIQKINALLSKARKAGARVIFVQSVYKKNDPRFGSDRKARRLEGGCLEGSWGSQIISELKPRKEESIVQKSSYDCWFGTRMEVILRNMKFGSFKHDSVHYNRLRNSCSVIVTGTAANVCVDKAALGFYMRGYDVIVPGDCISAKDKLDHNWALYQFKNYYQARITASQLIKLST